MAADLLSRAPAGRLPWLLAAGSLALAAGLGWQLYRADDHGDPIATSLTAFEKANRLTVFSAQLAPVVSAEDERGYGLLKSRQVAVIPARVDYTLDLASLDAAHFKWDAAGKALTVTLPPLQLSKPNLDEARAQYLREGIWITGPAQAKLTRDNTLLAERQAAEQAAQPALMELARGSARQAVAQNLAVPLQVAGYGKVRVTVRFEGEKEVQ
ncbi:MAG TPA: DUF4230 domain-containing protein [Novosphingobium sp.]|nr:DUF4230 domain-containing protein [Novosphingobium sp.]HQA18455.1 DUF4230 domain-containing protein [Novosphingobium sp.]